MIVMKKILMPTDFSEPSAHALHYAKALAATFHAELHLLHVIENPFVHGWTSEGYVAALPSFQEQLEEEAVDRLEKELSAEDRAGLRARQATRSGTPFLEIVRYAKAENIDLIVMGTHGRGTVAHLLMGSVAEKVVRTAICPVLTVRHPDHGAEVP